ncbi:MAG: choline-sulfatase [Alphaproteobacteria bacterium]|nr:choline-sulfatase [Alphaproteobacteria bacterium]
MSTQPNILVIQADQLTALCLNTYGTPFAKTPNIDKIAANGTVFVNTYCNSPVCGPSRASMMTGRLPSNIGVYDNAGEFLSSEPTYAHYLRMLGYQTTLVGKMHFVGPDQLHGFERRLTTDIYPSDYGWTADWSKIDEEYSPSRMSLHSVVEAGICQRSLQIDYDDHVFNTAKQELFDIARSADQRPFLLHASFTHPHNPFVTTQEFWDLYDHDAIPMPTVDYIPYAERDPWSQRYFMTIRQDEFDISEDQLRTARHAYFAMTSYFDSLVGGLVETLERTNLMDNTYIFVISDHGDMLGERGMWYKFNPYEGSVRVPMISMGPEFKKGHCETALTTLADLLPTFTDIATNRNAYEFTAPLDGKSLFDLPAADSDNDLIFFEYCGEGVHAPALMCRHRQMKYVRCGDDPEMLFDLATDPHEQHNLAQDMAFSHIITEMRDKVASRWDEAALAERVVASQKNRLFVQEAMKQGVFPSWDYTPPFDATRAYVRGAIDPNTTATKARKRFPFVPTTPPQIPRDKG